MEKDGRKRGDDVFYLGRKMERKVWGRKCGLPHPPKIFCPLLGGKEGGESGGGEGERLEREEELV